MGVCMVTLFTAICSVAVLRQTSELNSSDHLVELMLNLKALCPPNFAYI